MSQQNDEWSSQALYDLTRRYVGLFPHGAEFHEGGWYATGGPRYDFGLGPSEIKASMLMNANKLLGLEGAAAHKSLTDGVADLDRRNKKG